MYASYEPNLTPEKKTFSVQSNLRRVAAASLRYVAHETDQLLDV
jgi:hypothetical protein